MCADLFMPMLICVLYDNDTRLKQNINQTLVSDQIQSEHHCKTEIIQDTEIY